MPTIKLTSIICYATSENGLIEEYNDEVFVIYQSDAGIPVRYPTTGYQRMNPTADPTNDVVQTWNISDLEISFENEVLITLWDNDSPTGELNEPTFLINKDYRSDNYMDLLSFNMKNRNNANYTINIAVA